MKNKSLALITLIITLSFLTGCVDTVAGIGKDMQRNGKELQRAVSC